MMLAVSQAAGATCTTTTPPRQPSPLQTTPSNTSISLPALPLVADHQSRPHDLAIRAMLPSLAVDVGLPTTAMAQSPSTASRASRPRLRLNTLDVTQPHTWTKTGASSLRLDTLSAVSPTARNTFSNAQARLSSPSTPSSLPSPATVAPSKRPARPRLAIDSSVVSNNNGSIASVSEEPSQPRTPVDASTLSAVSSDSSYSSSSAESVPAVVPYRASYGLRSCLRNSPLPAAMSAAALAKRPMFPAQKRVSFRAPLDEEIHTTVYTVAHSELELGGSTSSLQTDSEGWTSNATNTDTPTSSNNLTRAVSDKATKPRSKPRVARLPSNPKTGDKRSSDSEESDSDTCPETPVAGRRKKQREWVWTLGPIDSQPSSSPPSSPSLISSSPTFSSSDTASTTTDSDAAATAHHSHNHDHVVEDGLGTAS